MMEDTSTNKRKKPGKLRGFLWAAILVALALGLGFVATQGELSFSDTLSTVREISQDAKSDLRSTVDSAVRPDEEREELIARISELESRLSQLEAQLGDRLSQLEARSSQPVRHDDEKTRLGRRIEFELFSTEAFDLGSIDVAAADDGAVTLTGTVRAEAERVLAKRIAEEVPGVTKVVSELQIEKTRSRAESDEHDS